MYNDNGPDWVARVMIALVEETVGVHGMKNQSPGCHVGNGIESGGLQGWWRKVERDRGKEDVVVAVRGRYLFIDHVIWRNMDLTFAVSCRLARGNIITQGPNWTAW